MEPSACLRRWIRWLEALRLRLEIQLQCERVDRGVPDAESPRIPQFCGLGWTPLRGRLRQHRTLRSLAGYLGTNATYALPPRQLLHNSLPWQAVCHRILGWQRVHGNAVLRPGIGPVVSGELWTVAPLVICTQNYHPQWAHVFCKVILIGGVCLCECVRARMNVPVKDHAFTCGERRGASPQAIFLYRPQMTDVNLARASCDFACICLCGLVVLFVICCLHGRSPQRRKPFLSALESVCGQVEVPILALPLPLRTPILQAVLLSIPLCFPTPTAACVTPHPPPPMEHCGNV